MERLKAPPAWKLGCTAEKKGWLGWGSLNSKQQLEKDVEGGKKPRDSLRCSVQCQASSIQTQTPCSPLGGRLRDHPPSVEGVWVWVKMMHPNGMQL